MPTSLNFGGNALATLAVDVEVLAGCFTTATRALVAYLHRELLRQRVLGDNSTVLPECLLDEDAEIEIEKVSWAESSLRLDLRLLSDASQWRVTCIGASAWRIQDRWAEGLRILDDDPVLWQSQFAIYTTYFRGKPANPHRAACDVLSAIPRGAGVLEMAPNQLADLLATGNGSLGSLPIPAIRLCQPILKAHAVDLYHLGLDDSELPGRLPFRSQGPFV